MSVFCYLLKSNVSIRSRRTRKEKKVQNELDSEEENKGEKKAKEKLDMYWHKFMFFTVYLT